MISLRACILLLLTASTMLTTHAQTAFRLAGRVVDAETGQAVEFASLRVEESGQWAVSDEKGAFTIREVQPGRVTLSVQCLGYQKRQWPMTVTRDIDNLRLKLSQQNLKLSEVTVTARRKQDEATTSYTIDRQALEQQQILNIGDIGTLLPGGKTVNPTLMSDARLALRSGAQEKGNASFGTAVEVDGLRLDNNATDGETAGASTRTVASSSVERIEIVTGIPSVEYGDLSNGIVKVHTRRGKSPFVVEGTLNQHTRQVALNKGFDLGGWGVLNASAEHARSFSDAASPHTAYQRNVMGLHYMNVFMKQSTPLTLNIGVTANVGGYNAEADPDNELQSYSKARDNALRTSLDAQWLLNRPWLTNISLQGAFSYTDRRTETYAHTSSASTQPYLHSMEEGYFGVGDGVTLSPTGYWYVLTFNDSKPMSWSAKLKGEQNGRIKVGGRPLRNRLTAGVQYSGSHNQGRGTYYDDLALATSNWREYRYDRQPTMHNVALYVEDKILIPTRQSDQAHLSSGGPALELTLGLRHDMTLIGGSSYGTVQSLSPRGNARYVFWRGRRRQWVSDLEVHGGWGKSTKLPSFQVLYPRPSYSDIQVFSSPSTADNTSHYAYYTRPMLPQYNPDLRWQYTNQTDLGVELNIKGTRIMLSAFHHRTHRSYMSTKTYTPFTYYYTGQEAVQQSGIPVADRAFTIDHQTGTVTIHSTQDASLAHALPNTPKQTFNISEHYINATPLTRYGLEWVVDFAPVKALHTSLRLDGNYYEYRGTDDVLFADVPMGISNIMSNGQPYQYVGYYRGTNVTGAGSTASASVANGSLSRTLNLNATLTTHIPRLRLIVALRLESSLLNYRRALSELSGATRSYMLADDDQSGFFGEPYDPAEHDRRIIVYPEYYSTWDEPDRLLPFAEQFAWARDNDVRLYNELSKLVVRSNYAYTMNPNRLSAYYSANLSVTKEMGDHVSVSFYANNFWNTMRRITSSQTGLETSLFDSGFVPAFYYGLTMRVKI